MSVLHASVVQRSYARCSRDKAFFDAFYNHFISSSEEVKNHFLDTSRAKQKVFIHNGIATMLLFAMGSRKSADRLEDLARQHGPEDINVDPSLYPLWVESLIRAISEFDPEFDDDVEHAWRATIQTGIEQFLEVD